MCTSPHCLLVACHWLYNAVQIRHGYIYWAEAMLVMSGHAGQSLKALPCRALNTAIPDWTGSNLTGALTA